MSAFSKRSWRILRQAVAGASRTLPLLLASCFWILTSSPSHAFIDTNNNGVSDIWEKQYNSGNLLSNFDPAADPDGDGWTNEVEAISGTNPFDGNLPIGCVRPTITHIPAVYTTDANGDPVVSTPEAAIITWPTIAGKKYTLCATPDLTLGSWLIIATTISDGSLITENIQLTQPDGSTPEKLFWRVNINDTDSDGDTLTDAEENRLGSSIYFTDTNGDGIDDAAAAAAGLDPSAATEDTNGDGVPDNEIYIPVFEVTEKSHDVITPFGFGTRAELNKMYFTKVSTDGYQVNDAPYYPNIADGQFIHTDTYLTGGALSLNSVLTSSESGLLYTSWLVQNSIGITPALGNDETLQTSYPTSQTTTSPDVITSESRETTWTEIKTSPWEVTKVIPPNTVSVVRSGTSTFTFPHTILFKDLIGFPQVWQSVVKPAPWYESPEIFGPLNQIGQGIGAVGYIGAAEIVHSQYILGSFGIGPVTISAPTVDSSPVIGRERFLKSFRWRWARFNPRNPFEYEYAAPPSSLYRKNFHFLVQQHDYLNGSSGVIKDETNQKEIIEIEFSGAQGGTGWQDIPLAQFNSHKIEDPSDLAEIGYSGKTGYNKVTFSNLPQKIAFDSNRDGEVTLDDRDQNTSAAPFRFWINNDQDDVESGEPTVVTTTDSFDSVIKTQRDLEDFCRLKIDAGVSITLLRNGEIQIGLKFKNFSSPRPGIRIWENGSYQGKTDYLTENSAAAYQIQQPPFGETAGGTVIIPSSYWSTKYDSIADLLFEGTAKGSGQLVITLHDKYGVEIGEGPGTWLKLMDVKEMYQRARVVNEANQIPDAWINTSPPAQTWNWDPDGKFYVEDPNAAPVTAIFVHGWRTTYSGAMNYSDTSYKRLWHHGFKGKFYSFRWATYSEDTILPYVDLFTYNPSEYRAWLCGPTLSAFVNQLPNPTNRNLIAHSMGNVVSGAALRAGMEVKNYAMCNAAMSAMAYDPNPALIPPPTAQLPTDLATLKTPDTDLDVTIRTNFGLSNKFNVANGPFIYNFGLPNDFATGAWSANNELFKPEYQYNLNSSYDYQPFEPLSERRLSYIPDYNGYIHGNPVSLRYIVSIPEAMGYVTKSKTRTAGANLDTRGVIDVGKVVNMADFGFGSEHSAEWLWNYQATHLFWERLAKRLELDPK
ncbi:MAG: thrombospondin type 3 repeat-containing protein [Luteolibacter sp.]